MGAYSGRHGLGSDLPKLVVAQEGRLPCVFQVR